MKIKTKFTTSTNIEVEAIYYDQEHLSLLEGKKIFGVHALCFYQNKLLVVYAADKDGWQPAGGAVEEDETYEEAVIREVQEESNMRVLKQKLIAFQDAWDPKDKNSFVTQTRSVCLIEPIGEFTKDPDGDITEIKLIDPKDYKQYFDWGEAGDRLMEQVLKSSSFL